MKTPKKFVIQFLSAVFMVLLFTIPAQAANCTCGQSSRPHDASHNVEYVSNGASGHMKLCFSCMMNGHSEDCAQVVLDRNEAHSLSISGSGSSRVQRCGKCDYSAAAACEHKNAKWQVIYPTNGSQTSETTCVKYCTDCRSVVTTKQHKWKYVKSTSPFLGDAAKQHSVICADCSYKKISDEAHTFKYTYKKPARPNNPASYKIVDSMLVYPSTHHQATGICTKCGYKTSLYQEHSFKSNKCSKCKLAREILPAVSGTKCKQTAKHKYSSFKTTAKWVWDGIKWRFYDSGTVKTHLYKSKVSWKKNSKAYGYIYSVNKSLIKSGSFLDADQAKSSGDFGFTKKTSIAVNYATSRPATKATIYVAPVSKYGFVGKVKKITWKVK